MKDLVEFAAQYGIVQNTLLRELSIPYAILLDDGKAVWMNDEFEAILGGKPKGEAYISKYIPELNRSIFPKEDQQKVTMEVYYDDKEYQAELRRVSVEGFSDTEQLMELPKEKEYFIAVYLQDVTELNRTIRENEEQRMVAGLVYIDNYDEVIDSVEEVRQSLSHIDARSEQDIYSGIVAQLLSAPKQPTAICVSVDAVAAPLLKELRRMGWRVPQDVSLVGFDDDDTATALDLTTMHQDPAEIGRIAARKTLALLNGETLDEPFTVMPTSLVLRGTTERVSGRPSLERWFAPGY